jgi:outer membrane protein OmpA-like peptidoglycan-associated protein
VNKPSRIAAVLFGVGLLDVAYIDFVAGPALFSRRAPAGATRPVAAAALSPAAVALAPPVVVTPLPPAEPAPGQPESEAGFEDVWVVKFPETGQVSLGASALGELKQLSERLSASHELRIKVIGHADERGDPSNNYRIGALRALAVAEQLQRAGFRPDQIDVSSKGEEAPVTAGSDSEAWAENRRAEIVVQARRSRKIP